MKAKVKTSGKVVELDRNNIIESVDRNGFISHKWVAEVDGKTTYLGDDEIEVLK